MSGHSKFANIKHKKEKNDAAKGKVFTKIGREIAVAEQEVSVYRYEGSVCDHGASAWDHKKYFKQEVLSEERTVDRFI